MLLFQVKSLALANTNNNLAESIWSMMGAKGKDGKSVSALDIYLNGTQYLKDRFAFLKYWPDMKDCFNGETNEMFRLIYGKAFGGKGNEEVQFYVSSQLQPEMASIGFKDIEGFLKFNSAISKDMAEGEKVGLMAVWLDLLAHRYDDSRAKSIPNARSGNDVWDAYIGGQEKIAICGDINGSAARVLAEALGLKQASLVISTVTRGHIISLVKGKEGYYAVDYMQASYLGKNLEVALDKIRGNEVSEGKMEMRFSPFIVGTSQGTAFEEGVTEKSLYQLTGFVGDEIKHGFSAMASGDKYGNLGAEANFGLKRLTVGAFVLNAPISETLFEGVKLDYAALGANPEGKKRTVIALPRLFVAGAYAKDQTGAYPVVIAQIVPVMLDQALWEKTRLQIKPLVLDAAYTAPGSGSGRMTSTLGLISEFSKNGKRRDLKVSADFRLTTPGNDFYKFSKPKVATKINAGFSADKYAVTVSVKPESIDNKVDLDASGKILFGKKFSVLVFVNAELLPSKFEKSEKQKAFDGINGGMIFCFN